MDASARQEATPLCIEFSGAIHHAFARGNRREAIHLDDHDRQGFIDLVGSVCDRFNWSVHAYCLMGHHYHLVLETPDGNLACAMRQLNGVHTQQFKRRHRRDGHLFRGRYNAILVQRGHYLLELTRYVVLNPVRTRMYTTVSRAVRRFEGGSDCETCPPAGFVAGHALECEPDQGQLAFEPGRSVDCFYPLRGGAKFSDR